MSELFSGWWYARLYPGGLAHLDAATVTVLSPLAQLAEDAGAQSWFFLRYTDWAGPHLRFRVHGHRDLLDRLHRLLPGLARQCEELASTAQSPFAQLTPVDTRIFGGRRAGAEVALYEPEEGKYGGPAGVALAEELFQTSSELALWAARYPKIPDRAALTVLLMRDARVAAWAGGEQNDVPDDVFWGRHLQWWTADAGKQAGHLRRELREQASQDRHAVARRADELGGDPAVARWRDRWQAEIASYLVRARRARIQRSQGHLIFHQNHMTANRLGILPREEALLGIIASSAPPSAPRAD